MLRCLPFIVVALTAPLAGVAQSQSAWPERQVRIVMPFPAGGASDVMTRILAERLQARFGQSFVVENRTGAGGNIGMEAGGKAAPDGYTITSATIGTLSINQHLHANLPYDPEKGFVYATTFWMNCNMVMVSPTHNPAKTLPEFIAWAKSQPKGVTYGSSGVGTTPHLAGELFRLRTGAQATHVPARGAPQTIPMILSGDLTFAIDNIASYTAYLANGQVRPLATTCPERWPTFPNVPTMAESGMPDFVITSWGALVFPAGTPAAIVDRLSAAVAEIGADSAIQQRFLAAGARLVPRTPAETTAFVVSERSKWREIVRLSGAKPE
ncbi:MAG: Bug family tripartite tricarboxylate transporter substrate binding protein, partial [Burkholderiales bacterium]